MSAQRKTGQDLPKGIRRRHARSCAAAPDDDLAVCSCRPSYQAQAGPRSDRRTKTAPTLAAAKAWKRDTDKAFAEGTLGGDRGRTFEVEALEWMTKAESGLVKNRAGKPYKPSVLRTYRRALEVDLLPVIGDARVRDITRGQLNRVVEGFSRSGLAPQTVRNTMTPVRAVYRYLMDMERITANPTTNILLPATDEIARGFVDPERIPGLLEALHPDDRALWAVAFYNGPRRGELMALRWTEVDLAADMITIKWSYDAGSRSFVRIKTTAGQHRRLPIIGIVHDLLMVLRMGPHYDPKGLVFPRKALAGRRVLERDADLPFSPEAVGGRARTAWEAAALVPVTLHEARHSFASMMIAAMAVGGDFNPKVLQDMLGHESIGQTYDRYGHLFPGAQAAAGRMLDAFLETRAENKPRALVSGERFLADLEAEDSAVARRIASDIGVSLARWEKAPSSTGGTQADSSPVIRSVSPDEPGSGFDQVSVQRGDPRGDA